MAALVDATLALAGVQEVVYAVQLSGTRIEISAGVVAGVLSFLSAISVSGTSIYGTEWLQTDGRVELTFKAGGLAIGTVAGMAIVAAIFWESLWEGLEKDAPIGTVVSVLGLLAVGWIASRSVTSFLAGRRSPE